MLSSVLRIMDVLIMMIEWFRFCWIDGFCRMVMKFLSVGEKNNFGMGVMMFFSCLNVLRMV